MSVFDSNDTEGRWRPINIVRKIVLLLTAILFLYISVIVEFPVNLIIGLGLLVTNLFLWRYLTRKRDPGKQDVETPPSQSVQTGPARHVSDPQEDVL